MTYDWSIYDRNWMGYPPSKQGEIVIKELKHYGDPVALAWWPNKTMPPKLEEHIYKGPLRLVHCEFMMRARFRRETYILDGITSRPDPPVCKGDGYVGLASIIEGTEHGAYNAISNPINGKPAEPRIYGTMVAARRNLKYDYTIVDPKVRYLGIAPLSESPFDPDVVVLFGTPQKMMYVSRALQWWSGITPKSRTGPGTCSSCWAETYMTGEPRYTLGCFGVFSVMGMNPNNVAMAIPSEMMPSFCNVLELWRDRGREMFYELPPDEEREHVRVPDDYPFTKQEDENQGYIKWEQKTGNTYQDWAQRRRKKGLYVPEK